MTLPAPVEAAGGLPAIPPETGGDAGQLPPADGTDAQSPAEVAPGSGLPPPPGSPDQQTSADQAATAASAASQSQPVNVVIEIRINSPGDNGPVTQKNTTVAAGGAANGASSAQSSTGSGSAPQTASQQAATGQNAAGTAAAAQDQPANTVVSVRNGSPGKNRSVSQSNTGASAGTAENQAATQQQRGTPKPAGARKSGRQKAASTTRTKVAAPTQPGSLHPASAAPASAAPASAASASAIPAKSPVRYAPPAREGAKAAPRRPSKHSRPAIVMPRKTAGLAAALPHWLTRGVPATPSAFETGHRRAGSGLTMPTVAALLAALLAYASFRWTTAVGTAARARRWRRRA